MAIFYREKKISFYQTHLLKKIRNFGSYGFILIIKLIDILYPSIFNNN